MKRFGLLLTIVALVTVSLVGVSTRSAHAADASTIIIGYTDSAGSLDNADAYDNHAWEILTNTGEGLLKNKVGTLEIVPGLATDMPKISADGLTYTFTLRDGLTFADGTPLTAQTEVDSVMRTMTLKGQVSGLATAYLTSVTAPDAKTVVFKLQRPVGFFNALITTPAYFPVNPKIYPADKLVPFPDHIDGVGQYKLVSYKAKEQAVLQANDKYYGDKPLTPQVILRYFDAAAAQLSAAVEKGDVDIAWRSLGTPDIVRLKKTAGINVYVVPNGRILYLNFNHKSKPFDDVNVRQAIASLIDRDEMIDRAYQGQVKALYSMIPPGYLYVTDAFKKAFNSPQVDKAVALLAKSGYTKDKPLTIEFNWPLAHYGAEASGIADVVKSQLEKSGVIKVTITSTEWSTYIKTVSKGGYPFFLLGWFPDYPDTDTYMTPWGDSSANEGQGTNYKNPTMDKLLQDAGATADTAKRADLYAKAQELWATDAVTVPLLIVGEYTVYKDGIVGADKVSASFLMNYSIVGKGTAPAATMAATAAK